MGPSSILQIKDNVLAHTPDTSDVRRLQRADNFRSRRPQRLRFRSQPNGINDISREAICQSTRDGFDFGKFGHQAKVPGRMPEVLQGYI